MDKENPKNFCQLKISAQEKNSETGFDRQSGNKIHMHIAKMTAIQEI